jgi:UDP-GlcNAc:undecaprenyl-phosphate GlcNAc-1-phosphate transferase
MSPDLRSAPAFAIAAIAVWLLTPFTIRLATRLNFLDVPSGYKGHKDATPYLGGTSIVAGLLIAAFSLGGLFKGEWPLLVFVAALWALGTLDDRMNSPIALRLGAEIGIAVALWALGDGWHIFRNEILNLPVTVVWIVGVVNAFNLMDNMDGAAATAAAVSAAGAGSLALILGGDGPAPLCFALAGACVGFLPYNLARPARIFMGDGGSLPIGLLVAALTISAVHSNYNYLGPAGVVVGGLLVGLVILDTVLVTYSRTRAGRPVLSGGRDHLTHRLVERLGSPRAVAVALAAGQFALCGVTIAVARAGFGWILLAGSLGVAFGGVLIWQLERPWLFARVRPEVSSPRLPPVEPQDAERQPEGAIA